MSLLEIKKEWDQAVLAASQVNLEPINQSFQEKIQAYLKQFVGKRVWIYLPPSAIEVCGTNRGADIVTNALVSRKSKPPSRHDLDFNSQVIAVQPVISNGAEIDIFIYPQTQIKAL